MVEASYFQASPSFASGPVFDSGAGLLWLSSPHFRRQRLSLGLVLLPASWSCVPGGSPVFVPTPGLVFLWAAWSRFLVGSLVLCSHFLLVAFVQWWAVPPSLKKRFRKTSIGLSYVKKEKSQIETLIS